MSGWFKDTPDTRRLLAQEYLVLDSLTSSRGIGPTQHDTYRSRGRSRHREVGGQPTAQRPSKSDPSSLADMAHALDCAAEFRLRELNDAE